MYLHYIDILLYLCNVNTFLHQLTINTCARLNINCILNYHIGRLVLSSLCVGDLVRLFWVVFVLQAEAQQWDDVTRKNRNL